MSKSKIEIMMKAYPEVLESDLGVAVLSLAFQDANQLIQAEKSYGSSWRDRGGIGAFMNLARKWDRLERAAKAANFDIFQALRDDPRTEGIADDLRDLRHYTLLIDLEAVNVRQFVKEEYVQAHPEVVLVPKEDLRPARDDDPVHVGGDENV